MTEREQVIADLRLLAETVGNWQFVRSLDGYAKVIAKPDFYELMEKRKQLHAER